MSCGLTKFFDMLHASTLPHWTPRKKPAFLAEAALDCLEKAAFCDEAPLHSLKEQTWFEDTALDSLKKTYVFRRDCTGFRGKTQHGSQRPH